MKIMKIVADLERCIGAGQCVANAERFFTQDEETGQVIIQVPTVTETEREEVELAIYACPTRALSLIQ